jgi:hemerythrin
LSPDPAAPTTIELHHRVQLGLLRAMEHHLVCEGDRAEAADTLAQLLAFTKAHFDAEELLMRHHRYPGLEGHAAAHGMLYAEALAVGQAHGAGDPESARATVVRLRKWLLEHIEGSDAAFDAWCRENRVVLE